MTIRLQENFSAVNKLGNRPYNLSLSVGIALFDDEATHSIEDLLAKADRAMYEAKSKGKDQAVKVAM